MIGYSTYVELLDSERQLGTRLVAKELLTIQVSDWRVDHFLWLARRNYIVDLINLIDRDGCEILSCIPDEAVSDLLNHFPNKIATRLANTMFWLSSLKRRIYLRPYINNQLAIKIFNKEFVNFYDENLITEKLRDVIDYCDRKGFLKKTWDQSNNNENQNLEIELTDGYRLILPIDAKENYPDHYNFGLRKQFEPSVRTILYQNEFIKKQSFYIQNDSNIIYFSTQQKLLLCGSLGPVLAYLFPDIGKIIIVWGWVAWPILIYDLQSGSITSTKHRMTVNGEDYRPYIESVIWRDDDELPNDGVALLIGCNRNIGHFFHNELSALHNLFLTGDIKYVDKILCYQHVPFNLNSFIKFLKIDIPVHQFTTEDNLIDGVNNCKFVLRVTDVTVSQRLATDLINYSQENLSCTLFDTSLGFIRILFTIRTGRRILLNQVELYISAIRLLNKNFGKVLIIFDGVTDVGGQDISKLIEDETHLTTQIVQCFRDHSDVAFESIIGKSMEEKIWVINQCDLAITVKGNGLLPTVQWVANVPTFVHGNTTDMGVFFETDIGEDLFRPFVISPSVVQDSSSKQVVIAHEWSERHVDSYYISEEDFLSQLSIFLKLQFQ